MPTTYKRGQSEWALWQYQGRNRNAPGDLPKIFRTRINRLLEIDREPNSDLTRRAFCETGVVGTGNELRFTVFDTFVLGLGLDLLNAGFKQREVVFALSHIRPDLEKQFNKIDRGPGLDRNRLGADDHPDLPTYKRKGTIFADPRVFALFERIETTEMFG